MTTNFPTSLDTLTNPTSTDSVATVDHAAQHANVNDSIEALEAKVGVNSSAVTTTHDYKLSGVTASDKAVSLAGTEVLTNKTLTSPKVGTAITDTNGNEIIETPATASAVNHLKVTNAITGTGVLLEGAGDDTNIPIRLRGKGSSKVQLGDADLKFPDVDGSSSQVLTTDGSGNLSWGGQSSNKLEVDTTEVTVTTTTTETTLFDYTVAGGTLSTSNAVRFKIWCSNYGNEDTWTFRLKYGATTVATATIASTSNISSCLGVIEGEIVADGSTTAQKGAFRGWFQDSVGDQTLSGAANNFDISGFIKFGTATEASASDRTLSVTVQNSATNPSIITAEWWTVEKIG